MDNYDLNVFEKTAAKFEQIMERLIRLNVSTSVNMHGPSWDDHNSRWYVYMPSVDGWNNIYDLSGATPEEALSNAWQKVLEMSQAPGAFLRRNYCNADELILNKGPVLFVR